MSVRLVKSLSLATAFVVAVSFFSLFAGNSLQEFPALTCATDPIATCGGGGLLPSEDDLNTPEIVCIVTDPISTCGGGGLLPSEDDLNASEIACVVTDPIATCGGGGFAPTGNDLNVLASVCATDPIATCGGGGFAPVAGFHLG